jgi:lipoprotein-releasing system permease protein
VKFELFVAARYLRAKRRQAVVSIITIISVIGVAAGVASLIVALAINNGFRQDLQDRLLSSISDVTLMRTLDDGISNWRSLMERLQREPHVVAAAPSMYEQVMISRGQHAAGGVLKAVIPAYENKVSGMLKTVKFGDAAKLDPPAPGSGCAQETKDCVPEIPPIIVGKDLATNLGATVGSFVTITSPQGELTPMGIVPKIEWFKVVGIFDSGFYDYDSAWGLIRLADAQRLFGVGDVISVIQFKVDDIYKAPQVSEELAQAAGAGFTTKNWMEENKALFHALRLEKVVTFITIGLIVFVAALNILISLIMMVMEKTRDIAVLMSMGARRRQVRRIFIFQGLLIGVVGTLAGLMIGYGIALTGAKYHPIALSAEVYSIDYVPFAPRVWDGILVAVVAMFVSFVATLYPSWSAARVLPAEALRYE